MSLQARQALVNHKNTVFRAQSQRDDLLDPNKTQTELIALLMELCEGKGYPIVFTAIRSDHSDDSGLGLHSHANGYCVDCWPLTSPVDGDYLDAGSGAFQAFLEDIAASPWLYQIGLGGSARTDGNRVAAGPTVFDDSGEDHVHIGTT